MNYHIIKQDKFFNDYIEDIYRIHEENNNVIWVRGEPNDSKFFSTSRPVEYIGSDQYSICERLKSLNPNDRIFVAWYDMFIGEIILKCDLPNKLYVYPLGADFYGEPEWWHSQWLFDPVTRRKVKWRELIPRFLSKKPWRWYRIYRWVLFKKKRKKEYKRKLATIRRIDYIVLPEHSTSSYDLIKALYPGCKAKLLPGTFEQNVDKAKVVAMKCIPSVTDSLKVLLGNSSDPTGNHIEALRYLRKSLHAPAEIYCILSYGDQKCREWVIKAGHKYFGERFHPILDYMTRDDYISFVNEMDFAVMYHNRSQAAGIIMTSLTMGKPVFMKPDNALFLTLKRIGVQSVYDVNDLPRLELSDVIRNAHDVRSETEELLSHEFSIENRLSLLKQLLGPSI